MKLLHAVPYAVFAYEWDRRGTKYYATPSRESWSFSPLKVEVDEDATFNQVFQLFEDAIKNHPDGEDSPWGWMQHYANKVRGFALVKPEMIQLLETPSYVCSRDGEGDAIANYKVAFCVQHAEFNVEKGC